MPLFSRTPRHQIDLLFDIESDMVRTAAAVIEAGKQPHTIPLAAEPVVRTPHTDVATFTSRMIEAVQKAAAASIPAAKKAELGALKPGRIHFILSSPWVVSKLSYAEKHSEKEAVIRRSSVASLIDEQKTGIASAFAVGDSEIVDVKLFEVTVNGYPVLEYEGKRGTSFGGTLAVSVGSKKVMHDVKLAANRSFRPRAESFHASNFLRYASLRSLLPGKDFVWLQVHGEVTDAIAVRGGACILSGSFPFGTETLLRRLARVMKSTDDVARSSLLLLASGDLNEKGAVAIQAAASEASAEWAEGLASLLEPAGGASEGPVYLAAHDGSAAFERALRSAWPSATLASPSSVVAGAPDPSFDLYAIALGQSHEL